MNITVEENSYCQLNIQFEAEPEQVENKRNEVVQYFKNAPVPGFRPGKATNEAIKHHHKTRIDDVLKRELAQHAYHACIAEKNIRPVGQPQFTSLHLDGLHFKCGFSINKIPDITLSKYKGFDLPKAVVPNAIEMAEKILQELRSRNGEIIPFTDNDFIQKGDSAIINYEGFLVNQNESVIKQEGELFTVGQAQVEAFNDNVLGMKIGEKREFTTVMPGDSTAKHIAGKEVKFIVELSLGSKVIPCPLDDTLAKKIGAPDVATMISMTQGMASSRMDELAKKHLAEQVVLRLIENHPFEIPNWLALFEGELLAKQYGIDWATATDPQKETLLEAATKNIRISIILDKIREEEVEAQLSDEEVMNLIKSNIGKYKHKMPEMSNKSDEEVFEALTKSGYMQVVAANIKDDFTVDFIIKNSTIVE